MRIKNLVSIPYRYSKILTGSIPSDIKTVVSIPYRYSKIPDRLYCLCLHCIVSIPYRYSKILEILDTLFGYTIMFQFLIGILKSIMHL